NKQARTFPMTQELAALLEEQRAKRDAIQKKTGAICPWVFTYNGKPFRSYRTAWDRACIKAGLPGKIPHDFRRTAVRNLIRAGIPERVAMQMCGHKTRAVFDRYNIVNEGDMDEAAKKLNGVSSGRVKNGK